MANRNTLHTKGTRPSAGSVDMSGNSSTAIAIISKALCSDMDIEVEIENIPRSNYVLGFVDVLNAIDINIRWVSDTKIRIKTELKEANYDLSIINTLENYEYGKVLIPVMIYKYQKCVVSNLYELDLKEYKGYGLKTEKLEKDRYEISIPLDYKPKPKLMDITRMTDLEKIVISFQKYFYKEFSIMSDEFDPITYVINNSQWDKSGDIVVNLYNQNEFNLFASIPIITKGELKIRNFNLSESLGYLMCLCELGGEYEVIGNELKVWRAKFHQKEYYDFSSNSYQEVGLLLLLLSSRITKQVRVEISKSDELLELIKELNIMGCKIDFPITIHSDWLVINVKPALISTVKMTIENKTHAESIILASISSSGNSTIKGLDSTLDTTPYLYDNLLSLGLNLAIK